MDTIRSLFDLAGSLATALLAGPLALCRMGPLGQALACALLAVGAVSTLVLVCGVAMLAVRKGE